MLFRAFELPQIRFNSRRLHCNANITDFLIRQKGVHRARVVYLPSMVSPALEAVFVDVDHTLVRSAGPKRMRIAAVVDPSAR